MRISDWSSDVCSSDLCSWHCALPEHLRNDQPATSMGAAPCRHRVHWERAQSLVGCAARFQSAESMSTETRRRDGEAAGDRRKGRGGNPPLRSEEHTSELQSLMRISYAVFCLKTKKVTT